MMLITVFTVFLLMIPIIALALMFGEIKVIGKAGTAKRIRFADSLGNAYTYRMPGGFPGEVTRTLGAVIEPGLPINQSTPPTAYGSFVKLVSGAICAIASGDTAAMVYGLTVRSFPVQETIAAGNEGFMAGTPDPARPMDILRQGYMSVLLSNTGNGTAAVKGGQVYLRVTVNGSNAVGQIETASDSSKCVAVTNCYFNGSVDGYGNVEIAYGYNI